MAKGPAKPRSCGRWQGAGSAHLATHGFFLDSNCKPQMPNTRGVGGLAGREPSSLSTSDRAENPLLFTGLALAGANRGGAGRR